MSAGLIHRETQEDYWNVTRVVLPGIRQRLKEIALLAARKTGLPTLGKKRCKKSIFPTYPS